MKKLELPEKQIIEYYENGQGCYSIAKKYNCSHSTINNILKRNNINTKKLPNNYRKFNLNENFFENINSEEKAYFLGLLMADGCIYKYNVRLFLQEKDSELLILFLKHLESEHHLYNIINNPKHSNQKGISISSKKLSSDLKKLGCIEKKSLVLSFPNIEENLINHFIRGYFDGDGSVFSYKRLINNKIYTEKGASFISSPSFIDKLKKILKIGNSYFTNQNKNKQLIIKSESELLKLKEFLYRNSTIYLKRKFDKFNELI